MKRCLLLLLSLALLSLSGCMIETVQDLQSKEETIELYREHRELFAESTKELLALWDTEKPHSIDLELQGGVVVCTIYRKKTDRVYLAKEKTVLQSSALLRLLELPLEHGISVDEEGIDFQCDGAGFGSNTAYCGIFYSPTGHLVDLPFYLPDLNYQQQGDTLIGSAPGNDNEVHIQALGAGYFYYYQRY